MATDALITNEVYYPDSDGLPVGETPYHIRNMRWITEPLEQRFKGDPRTCVAANMFVYYVEGKPRKHVSSDVFVARDVAAKSEAERRRYLVWEEGKGPDTIIELTSESTKDEDLGTKFVLYRDTLKVREYYLFDPFDEYLRPRLRGFRLVGADYVPIAPIDGRLPSEVLGLHLEADGFLLRFYDPEHQRWLPIPPEIQDLQQETASALRHEAEALRREMAAREQAEAARREAEAARQQAEAEMAELRREMEDQRKRLP